MESPIIRLCTFPGCKESGKWKPLVEVLTPENDKKFLLDFETPMCEHHKNFLTLDDMIGGNVFDKVKEMFKAKFIYPPKKQNMFLKWELVLFPVYTEKDGLISFNPINKVPVIR